MPRPVSEDRHEPANLGVYVDPVWRAIDEMTAGFVLLRPVRDAAGEVVDFACAAANPAAGRLLGADRESLLGQRLAAIAPEFGAPWTGRFAEVLRVGATTGFERALPGRSPERWLKGSISRVGDAVALAFDDISDRRWTEAELRRTQARCELATRFGRVDVFEADLSRGAVECSAVVLTELGVVDRGARSVTVPLSTLRELVSPDDWARVERVRSELAAGVAGEFELELRLRARQGKARWVCLRGAIERDLAGVPTRVRGTAIDVDERKRLEEALREAQGRAEAASQAKSMFVAGMSHEIRTPMSGILGLCEILRPLCPEGQAQEYLGMIHACASGLLGLLGDVLDLAQIEAGTLQLTPEPFQLRAALREILRPLEVLAQTKGLTLLVEVDAEMTDALVADLGRVRQVLVNLVGNAIKFTERGSVRVHVRRAGPLPTPGAELLHFIVEDTGIGIAQERRPRILQSFEKSQPPSRRSPGAGLGLAIAARLVDHLGGRIWFDSEEGLGSTFHFTVRVERMLELAGGPPQTSATRRLRVLLVEDDPISQVVTAHQLERAGHEVVVVDNGWRALAALAAGGFEAVFMDLEMPELDGVETLQMLRASADGPRVPVIALTARVIGGDRERCLEAGFDEYLSKPVDVRTLADALDRVVP